MSSENSASMGFIPLVKSDLDRYFHTGFRKADKQVNKTKIILETFIFKAGFHAVLVYRLSHACYRLGLSWIAWFLQRLNVASTGAEIEYNAEVGPGFFIAHPVGIVLGRGSRIGENFTIYQNVTFGARYLDPVRIFDFPKVGNNVTVFSGAAILGKVSLGDNCQIGANAVVLKDVPSDHSAVGVPAVNKPLKQENIQ